MIQVHDKEIYIKLKIRCFVQSTSSCTCIYLTSATQNTSASFGLSLLLIRTNVPEKGHVRESQQSVY